MEYDGRLFVARQSYDGGSIIVSIVDGDEVREQQLDFEGYASGLQLASTPLGLTLTASEGGEFDRFTPLSWHTSDGSTWTQSTISDEPTDITGLTWTGKELLAAGAKRPPDNPSMGPFRPALFTTTDGITWQEIILDGVVASATDSGLVSIVVDGERLVSSVKLPAGDDSLPRTLESSDDGRSWTLVGGDEGHPRSIGRAGSQLIGTGGFGPATSTGLPLLSADGDEWTPIDLTPVIGPHEYATAYLLASGGVALVSMTFDRPPRFCFDDPGPCASGQTATVVVQPDGSVAQLDLPAAAEWVSSATLGDNDDLHVVYQDADGLQLATWPASAGPPPTAPPPDIAEPTGPPVVQWDDELEPGGVYRLALYTHCGIDVLGRFNGLNWWIDGEPTAALDADDYSFGSLYGEIHVLGEDRIDYVLDGEVIAHYSPRDEEFPGCD